MTPTPVDDGYRDGDIRPGSDEDIMAIVLIVMMEAARSARDDLKAIMDQVKAANAAKKELCRAIVAPNFFTSMEIPLLSPAASTRSFAPR